MLDTGKKVGVGKKFDADRYFTEASAFLIEQIVALCTGTGRLLCGPV